MSDEVSDQEHQCPHRILRDSPTVPHLKSEVDTAVPASPRAVGFQAFSNYDKLEKRARLLISGWFQMSSERYKSSIKYQCQSESNEKNIYWGIIPISSIKHILNSKYVSSNTRKRVALMFFEQ